MILKKISNPLTVFLTGAHVNEHPFFTASTQKNPPSEACTYDVADQDKGSLPGVKIRFMLYLLVSSLIMLYSFYNFSNQSKKTASI